VLGAIDACGRCVLYSNTPRGVAAAGLVQGIGAHCTTVQAAALRRHSFWFVCTTAGAAGGGGGCAIDRTGVGGCGSPRVGGHPDGSCQRSRGCQDSAPTRGTRKHVAGWPYRRLVRCLSGNLPLLRAAARMAVGPAVDVVLRCGAREALAAGLEWSEAILLRSGVM
jgi:hypothetical protein